jgi:hypothetical protein
MTKDEYKRRCRQLPFVELKRLANIMVYIDKFGPHGEELRSILAGMSLAATRLFRDLIEEGVDDERDTQANVPRDH